MQKTVKTMNAEEKRNCLAFAKMKCLRDLHDVCLQQTYQSHSCHYNIKRVILLVNRRCDRNSLYSQLLKRKFPITFYIFQRSLGSRPCVFYFKFRIQPKPLGCGYKPTLLAIPWSSIFKL